MSGQRKSPLCGRACGVRCWLLRDSHIVMQIAMHPKGDDSAISIGGSAFRGKRAFVKGDNVSAKVVFRAVVQNSHRLPFVHFAKAVGGVKGVVVCVVSGAFRLNLAGLYLSLEPSTVYGFHRSVPFASGFVRSYVYSINQMFGFVNRQFEAV